MSRRGRKQPKMRLGYAIAGERERAESDFERAELRRQVHRKKAWSLFLLLAMVAALVGLLYLGISELVTGKREQDLTAELDYQIRAEVIDEDGLGQISLRMREYIANLERDFRDAGYTVTRVVLPTGTSRELYVDLKDQTTYFKMNTDRNSATAVEDAVRMMKYLSEREITPTYVDVRIEGQAYYK